MSAVRRTLPALAAGLAGSMLVLAQVPSPPGVAGAPNPPSNAARGPTLEVAMRLAQAALAACAADKLLVAAVVVDSGGYVKVSLMSDGARSMTPLLATRKAATALEFRQASSEVAARAATDDAVRTRLAANDHLLPAAGAVLLKTGNDIIGALAVSGGRSDQDEACALKSLQAPAAS